ncbi:MAG: hypothetical protein MZU84_05725 [Sphingobacterium sp.]|nr:hypothetical protein [Sphingobacterium sp.]
MIRLLDTLNIKFVMGDDDRQQLVEGDRTDPGDDMRPEVGVFRQCLALSFLVHRPLCGSGRGISNFPISRRRRAR